MIKQLRKKKGMNQDELAKKAKVGQGYISSLEAGKKTNPGLDVLKRLAKALDVTVSELIQ